MSVRAPTADKQIRVGRGFQYNACVGSRYISEREQPYDMYDVIIQVFIMDGLEFDKHGEMIYENTQMDRLTAYILEVLASLNHRWLCDFDCLALKIEDSPIGESTLVGAEIALLLKGKVRTI